MRMSDTNNVNRRIGKEPETAEAKRIREEELCWRTYAKEKQSEESKKEAQMEAMFEAHNAAEGVISEEHLLYTEPEERTARRERRKKTRQSKVKTRENAKTAVANLKVREENDEKCGTRRTRGTGKKAESRKSQVHRTEKLVKRANKIAPEV